MTAMKASRVVLLAAALAALCACGRESSDKGGPGERAGRDFDRAMDKAGQAVEQAGRNMQDASKGKKE
jgi:hypothetical protein